VRKPAAAATVLPRDAVWLALLGQWPDKLCGPMPAAVLDEVRELEAWLSMVRAYF
jgi:hypothetical protein